MKKKKCLITGGTSGIGLAIAKQLIRTNNLTIISNDKDNLEIAKKVLKENDVDIFKVNSQIITHNHICTGSNKCKITIDPININQIRWGMKVVGPDLGDPNPDWADGDVTVEDVNYNTAELILNKPIDHKTNPSNSIIPNQII